MNLFKRKNPSNPAAPPANSANLAEMVVKNLHEGIIITDKSGTVRMVNAAAASLIGLNDASKATGLDYGLILKIESKEGRELSDNENPLVQSMKSSQPLDNFIGRIITDSPAKRPPVAISMVIADGLAQNRIIIMRDVTKELEDEGEQTEFISTASHEMRTPVASIEGYLSLALNPQTATIDDRARGYLNAAHAASQHLGKLFQDLLDVTRLEDGKIRPNFTPEEMSALIETLTMDHAIEAKDAKLNFRFGSSDPTTFNQPRRISQVVYGFVDVNFMREIMDNLISNACKYTPAGGSIYVNVRGDGDRVLINVTDTGIGISASDLDHIFQKFYRADNSDTRTIGGTGLGLFIVKQRVEAMGGRIWAESAFGEGTTFYVSLPRITGDEYEKRMIAVRSRQMQGQMADTTSPSPSLTSKATASQFSTYQSPNPQPTVTQSSISQPSIPQSTAPTPSAPQPLSNAVSSATAPAQSSASRPTSLVSSAPRPATVSSPRPIIAPSPSISPVQPPPLAPTHINTNLNGEPK